MDNIKSIACLSRVLIVGHGNMGQRHACHLKIINPKIQVLFYTNHSGSTSKEYRITSSLESALAFKPLAAIICNAAPMHCEVACILVSKGIHVLIEKPLSNKLELAEQLYQQSLKYPQVVILVGYHLHYKRGFSFVSNLLKSSELGKLFYAKAYAGHYLPLWRPGDYVNSVSAKKSLGGGVLLESSHDYDYLRAFFGIPDTIFCRTAKLSNLQIDVEDTATSLFSYSSGFFVEIHQDMISQPPTRDFTVFGEKGTLHWDIRKDVVQLYENNKKEWNTIFQSIENLPEQTYIDELIHFMNCIAGIEKPLVSVLDGCETLKMVELAKKSAIETKQELVNG